MKSLIPWKQRSEERGGSTLIERPRDVLMQMRHELNSLFDRFFGDRPAMTGDGWPTMRWGFDVDDREDEIVVRAEAPGFESNDFSVEVVGNRLVLTAQRKEECKRGDGCHFRQGRLYRTVTLPHGVEADKIEASYHNGVLEVCVPKGQEAKGKRIMVKSA